MNDRLSVLLRDTGGRRPFLAAQFTLRRSLDDFELLLVLVLRPSTR